MDVTPLAVNGRVYLPLRYVAEANGYCTGYDAAAGIVYAYMPEQIVINIDDTNISPSFAYALTGDSLVFNNNGTVMHSVSMVGGANIADIIPGTYAIHTFQDPGNYVFLVDGGPNSLTVVVSN